MTGAGGSSLAFVKEDSFRTVPGDPTYYAPGRNPTVEELSLDNTLTRLREATSAEAVDSLAGNLEGTVGLSWAMSADTHEHVRDIVFNAGGTGFTSGLMNTSRWFLGAKYVDGTSTSTVERELEGCTPLEYSITYQQDTNTIRENLTLGYADETRNGSFTPTSITGPTAGSEVPFHGLSVDIDGNSPDDRLQSLTLSYSNISRFQRGASRFAQDAVLATPEGTLDMAAIFTGNDYLELAYGSSGTTDPSDGKLTEVSGSLTFSSAGSTVATYSLPSLKVSSNDWEDLINGDTDLTDPTTFHINGGISIA